MAKDLLNRIDEWLKRSMPEVPEGAEALEQEVGDAAELLEEAKTLIETLQERTQKIDRQFDKLNDEIRELKEGLDV